MRGLCHRFRLLLSVLLVLPCCLAPAAAADKDTMSRDDTLVMGLLPYVSPITLFNRFSSLVGYIDEELNTRVVLETAPNFKEFQARADNRMYDLLITAPHFVVLALDSGHYELIASPVNKLSAQIVVPADSRITDVRQLAAKVVVTPAAQALITKAGIRYLEQSGLSGSSQPVYKAMRTHNAAYQEMLGGKADAAIISINVLNKVLKEGAKLRSIGESPQLPGVGIMVARDLPADLKKNLQQLLVNMQKTKKGREALQKGVYPGYKAALPEDYMPMRVYLSD